MNLSKAIQYLEAEVQEYDVPEHCESVDCVKQQKVLYTVSEEHTVCGKCLVKYAKSYKEYVDQGGCCSFG